MGSHVGRYAIWIEAALVGAACWRAGPQQGRDGKRGVDALRSDRLLAIAYSFYSRSMIQDPVGNVWQPFARTSWLPGKSSPAP